METPDPSSSLCTRRRLLAGAGLMVLALTLGVAFWPANPDSAGPASTSASLASSPGTAPTGTAPPPGGPGFSSRSTSPSPPDPEERQPFGRSPHYPAALVIAGMEEDSARVEAIEALMETWVAANPRQAADWAGSLPAGMFRDDALSSLMVHWAARSPSDAAAWMNRTGVDDAEAASVLAGSWAATDPGAATSWAASMGNLESRRMATASAVSAWAATAPQAAAVFAEKLPDNDRASAITAVLATWGVSAPAEAAAWLQQVVFASESDQAIATAALVTPWTGQSPGAVSKYINTLPEGPAREAAASQFAVTAAAAAPAEALLWAMNLSDPDQRNQVVADTCESWYDGSPDTFREGIAEAIGLMEDPVMRRGVYEMLYDRDPGFQANLLQLIDQSPPAPAVSAPAPAPLSAPPPVAGETSSGTPAPLLPEPDLLPDEGFDSN